MSTHCVSMIKNSNLSLKIEEEEEEEAIVSILDNVDSTSSNGEEDHHEQLIKDQPIKTFDWSSILSSSKNEDSSNKSIPTSPYVHPLVKRSTSYLSEKSLEICTESLGSETGFGSDCFSSSPIFELEDSSDYNKASYHHHHYHHQRQYPIVSKSSKDFHVYNLSKRSISSSRSFPPSLTSTHMQSCRQNGRLILEVISVPPKNSLHAQRLDGHLLLTFINKNDSELELDKREHEVEEFEQVFDDIQEVEGNETLHVDSGGGGDEEESEEEEDEDEVTMMEHSLNISRGRGGGGHFWRKKPIMTNIVNNSTITKYYYNNKQVGLAPLANGTDTIATSATKIAACTQDLVLIRGKKASTLNNNLVPFLRSCKEPRRSLIIWEPYCIATS